jgi:trehalose-6-phosphate synthase
MGRAERRARIQRMRRHIMDHNVYRWAANVLGDLHELRMEGAEPVATWQAGVVSVPAPSMGQRKLA